MERDTQTYPEGTGRPTALAELVSRALATKDIGSALIASEHFTREEKVACMLAEPAHFAPVLASDEYYRELEAYPEVARAVYKGLLMRNAHLRSTPAVFEQQMAPYRNFLTFYASMQAPS